jgi:gluconokinase
MVIVVFGVSGSGKTAVGEALAKRLGWAFEDADDWHPAANVEKMHSGKPLTDEDREPWLQALNRSIQGWTSEGHDVILACSALKLHYRQELRAGIPAAQIRFVYLRGAYQEIDQRLRLRTGHFMPESLLKSQFADLEEPQPSEALIVEIHPSVASIVETIVSALHLTPSDPGTSGSPRPI